MELNLSGKRALVTGSTRGIGRAIATALVEESCRVVLNGLDSQRGTSVASELGVAFVEGDLTQAGSCQKLISQTLSLLGGIDILVCNVGSGRSMPTLQETSDEWYRVLELNLLSTTNMIAAAKEALTKSQGNIVCISSIAGKERLGAPATYAAAKAALNAYVRETAPVLGKEGVRINAIAPGNILFAGSVWEKKLEADRNGVEQMLQREVALQRLGKAEEVASLCAFLVSEKASFMTGGIYTVDGGQLRG